jgi:uncharacterized protein
MYIRIEQISADGLDLKFEETPTAFPVLSEMINQGECKFVAPIKTALRAIRIGDMVEVKGEINTVVHLPCGRCLKEYETSLKSRFDLTYAHPVTVAPADEDPAEVELSHEELGLIYFEGEVIDLRDAIQEQVILAFPIKALCQKDCKGLCSSCGNDLNEGDCGCDHQPPNGKFAALKNLKLNK